MRTNQVVVGAMKNESFLRPERWTQTVPIMVEYPGGPLTDKTITGLVVDCDGVPQVSSSSICTADGGVVSLVLSNTAPVEQGRRVQGERSGDRRGPTTVSVAAGSSTTLTFGGLADGTATYTITADGVLLADQVLEIDCAGVGGATLERACVDNDGTVTITVTNTSAPGTALPVEFVVSGPGTPTGPTTVSVAAGDSTQVTFTGVTDGEVTYTVTADGVEILDDTFTIDCDARSVGRGLRGVHRPGR